MEANNKSMELIEKLYLDYSKELLLSAIRLVKNESDAQDLVSETFYIAVIKSDTLTHHPNKIAWLYKVLHFCIKKLSVANTYIKTTTSADGTKTTKYIYTDFISYDQAQNIFKLTDFYEGDLFEDYKDILTEAEFKYLIYKFEFGLDNNQIANLLNKSKTATTSFGTRIKKKIKKFLYEKRDEHGKQ